MRKIILFLALSVFAAAAGLRSAKAEWVDNMWEATSAIDRASANEISKMVEQLNQQIKQYTDFMTQYQQMLRQLDLSQFSPQLSELVGQINSTTQAIKDMQKNIMAGYEQLNQVAEFNGCQSLSELFDKLNAATANDSSYDAAHKNALAAESASGATLDNSIKAIEQTAKASEQTTDTVNNIMNKINAGLPPDAGETAAIQLQTQTSGGLFAEMIRQQQLSLAQQQAAEARAAAAEKAQKAQDDANKKEMKKIADAMPAKPSASGGKNYATGFGGKRSGQFF